MPVLVLGLHHLVASRFAPAFAITLALLREKKGEGGNFLAHCSAQNGAVTHVVEMRSRYFDWTQALH